MPPHAPCGGFLFGRDESANALTRIVLYQGVAFATLLAALTMNGSPAPDLVLADLRTKTFAPLDEVAVGTARAGTLVVRDAKGREYARVPLREARRFTVGGALGTHTAVVEDSGKEVERATFEVAAMTAIDDEGGKYKRLLQIAEQAMRIYSPSGVLSQKWRGQEYRYFVHWMLDHVHTAKGMRYFSDAEAGYYDLAKGFQRPDGMIWSFITREPQPGYYETAYGPAGYAKRDGDTMAVRQPVENHPEYLYVLGVYDAWRASGDLQWLGGHLNAMAKALDYAPGDPARWSKKYGLLKRGYTIDSWDFQIDDEHLADFPLAKEQMIDPNRTKFGVFHGDNLGYAQACENLAAMMRAAGRDGSRFDQRAKEIRSRLDQVSWNGEFFRHWLPEDDIKRSLGVDEARQLSFGNCYATNLNISQTQIDAIVTTYTRLKNNLPQGSPGEWYAIYPPFERGVGADNQKWQYMNGGVHPHAAGELARGALTRGNESYGADVLRRLLEVTERTGGKMKFALTGADAPAPTPAKYQTINLGKTANMAIVDRAEGAKAWKDGQEGNDMRNLPTGNQNFSGVPYAIGPKERAAVAVGNGIAEKAVVPVVGKARTLYLLHAVNGRTPEAVAAAMTFRYSDGTSSTRYLMRDKHVGGWWFPSLKNDRAGVAWRGPNARSLDVGVTWAAIDNPQPTKEIRSIDFTASEEGAIYALLGMTLSDQPHPIKVSPLSDGGPDNWSGGTVTAALIEGLAGVTQAGAGYDHPIVAPRWRYAGVDKASVTVHLPAGRTYVSYRFRRDGSSVELELTGSADRFEIRVPFKAKSMTVDGKPAAVRQDGEYAVITVAGTGVHRVRFQ